MMLVDSDAFKQEVRGAEAYAAQRGAGYVYLISRFDDDDSTICFFGSLGFSPGRMLGGTYGVENLDLLTFKGGKKQLAPGEANAIFVAGKEFIPVNQVAVIKAQQMGGHAEEMFLRKFGRLCDAYGRPKKIDLFVSRIPCARTSSSWLIATPSGNVVLPCGCSPKLALAAGYWSDITWRLWWRDPYPNPDTQKECLAGLAQLQGKAIVTQYTP